MTDKIGHSEYRAGYLAALEDAKAAILKEAAAFASELYATPQPMGSFAERYACRECFNAVAALGNGVGTFQGTVPSVQNADSSTAPSA